MAKVFIPTLLQRLTGGRGMVEVDAATVGEIVSKLETAYPGLRDQLTDGGRLRANISVAIDGELMPAGLLEAVGPDSEVHFVSAISGGLRKLFWATDKPDEHR
jgi:sulfur-carrier protein